MRKECEKLFMKKNPNPLPLPTLKLSEPPGAVRPDGNQTPPLVSPAPRTVTSKINNHKSNRIHAVERGPSQAQDKLARDADHSSSADKQKK
jgi:hypothetical protein